MSCCGQRRLALVAGNSVNGSTRAAVLAANPFPPPAAKARTDVVLRYLGIGPFSARGSKSGRVYACGGAGTTIRADVHDAEALVRTRLFVRY